MADRNEKTDRYIAEGGSRCLHCKSDNITTTSGVEIHPGGAYQNVLCLDCSGEWTDEYTLTGVTLEEEA